MTGGLAALVSAGAPLLATAVLMAQQPEGSPAGWPCVAAPDRTYGHVAEATGGHVFLLHPSELGESSALLLATERHREIVFRADGELDDRVRAFGFPVDTSIDSLLVLVSLQCLQTVELSRPSGDLVQQADEDVELVHLQAVRAFTIARPAQGEWTVRVSGRGMTSVVVQVESDLRLAKVAFEPFADPGPPRHRLKLRARVSGTVQRVGFQLRSDRLDSTNSQDVQPVDEGSDGDPVREWMGEVSPHIIPTFHVVAIGLDARGYPFRRLHPQVFVTRQLLRPTP